MSRRNYDFQMNPRIITPTKKEMKKHSRLRPKQYRRLRRRDQRKKLNLNSVSKQGE